MRPKAEGQRRRCKSSRELAIFQDLGHKPGTYRFTRMHRNHCRSTVSVSDVVVPSSDTDEFNPALARAAIRVLPVKDGSFVILRYLLAGLE